MSMKNFGKKNKMKISLITTVKDEEKGIGIFLDSIITQSIKPDEIVIVDGGSTDGTLKIIQDYKLKLKSIKLIKRKGNRSVGRNVAIKNSKNMILACSDVGCILDKKWLEKITKPFEKKHVDVVAGFYKPLTHSAFEKSLATYTCTMLDKLDPENFLPSSRSIAFKKSAWKSVGGYNEALDMCEDLVFARDLKKSGLQFVTVKNAIVYWPQRKTIWQAAKQFFNYAKGDGQARYFRRSTPYLFGRYFLGLILFLYALVFQSYLVLLLMFFLFLSYTFWSIRKNYKYVNKKSAFLFLPLLQFTSDITVISGVVYGMFSKPNV